MLGELSVRSHDLTEWVPDFGLEVQWLAAIFCAAVYQVAIVFGYRLCHRER